MADTKDLSLVQGKTFSLVLRWETEPIIYRNITAIQQAAPVRITSANHGLPNGWRCAVTNVKGMVEINAEANSLREKDYNPITVIDADTIEINAINAAGFKAYVSGGVIQANSPVTLTGYSARMQIKDKVGGTVLKSLVSPTDIVIDEANYTITLKVSATDTAGFTWKNGVYDLELVSPTGIVTALLTGKVSVAKEVTT